MNAFLEHAETLFTATDSLRARYWDRFQELGIPAYAYLPLSQLRNFKIQPVAKEGALQKAPGSPYDIVFVNGALRLDLSDNLSDDIVLLPLVEAMKEYQSFPWEKTLREEKDSFAFMTAALAEGAVFLYIPPSTNASLKIINIQTAKSAFARFEILVGSKASCQITLKNYTQMTGPAFSSELINLHLEEDAECFLYKIDNHQAKEWAFSFVRAIQKGKSRLTTATATGGALSARYDFKVTVQGSNAETQLGGLAKLKGFSQAHTNVLVEHRAPHTASKQLFKSILDDVTRASFQGEIFVGQQALKTDAFQLNKSLLLSDKAIAYGRPQLQIFADDVKASHGATVGELDEETLFYLRSRGLPQEMARQLMVASFAGDLLSWFKEPLARAEAEKLLA